MAFITQKNVFLHKTINKAMSLNIKKAIKEHGLEVREVARRNDYAHEYKQY